MKISIVQKRALIRELRKINAVLEDDKIPPRIAIVDLRRSLATSKA